MSVPTEDGARTGLSGRLTVGRGGCTAVVVVHGLGGDAESHYCLRAARAAARRGWTCLRLNLRGADGSGEDLYHAGLGGDVQAALASPEIASHRRRFVLGYSLGGHVALHAARGAGAVGLAAMAAVCAPLDLLRGSAMLDAPRSWLYRQHILGGLRAAYVPYAARHPAAASPEQVRRARTIRAFDALTVVPRFGFADVGGYYRSQSIAPHIGSVSLPTLLVYARNDPVVPRATVADALTQRAPATEVWWIERGGHVGFPERVSRAGGPRGSLEDQLLDWLDGTAR